MRRVSDFCSKFQRPNLPLCRKITTSILGWPVRSCFSIPGQGGISVKHTNWNCILFAKFRKILTLGTNKPNHGLEILPRLSWIHPRIDVASENWQFAHSSKRSQAQGMVSLALNWTKISLYPTKALCSTNILVKSVQMDMFLDNAVNKSIASLYFPQGGRLFPRWANGLPGMLRDLCCNRPVIDASPVAHFMTDFPIVIQIGWIFHSSLSCREVIIMKVYAWYDTCVVVTYAKCCSNIWYHTMELRWTVSHWYWITMVKSFVKWAPRPFCHVGLQVSITPGVMFFQQTSCGN